MLLRIYKSSRNKSKSRQRSVDKTVSSCYEEEEFEFSARTLQSVQDNYTDNTTTTNNNSSSSAAAQTSAPPMRGLSIIRNPQQQQHKTTTTTKTNTNTTITTSTVGHRRSSLPNSKNTNTADTLLLETIDEKMKLSDDDEDLSSFLSLPTRLSFTKVLFTKKRRPTLNKGRSLTSHLDNARFIQFLYKDPRWKLTQYDDEVIQQFSKSSSTTEEEQQQLDMFSV